MVPGANLFNEASSFYDLDNREIVQDDIPFYLDYAAKYQGDILELACGTGRVALALAQNGFGVFGIDLSESMLHQFQLKLARQAQAVRDRIRLAKGDMADFRLNQQFSLIIAPFRSFQVLTTEERARKCLQCVLTHLKVCGVFIINVFRPYKKLDENWVYPETIQYEIREEKTGRKIIKKHRGIKIDVRKQIIYPEMIYQIEEVGGKKREVREPLELKYYYYEQLRGLLESSGFQILQEFGYYDKSPIGAGGELIFVCRKKDG